MTTARELLKEARRAIDALKRGGGIIGLDEFLVSIDDFLAQPEPEPVAWMFRYRDRGRFGKTDWTEWQPIAGSERPVIEHAECEAYPLFKVATG